MSRLINKLLYAFFFVIFLFLPNHFNKAKEILIYADSISYDEDQNIIAKGNAKIYQENKLIVSDLIIYNKLEEKIILPSKFIFKDENNNYFEGQNGYFKKNLNFAEFDYPKIRLNDGSRLIGNKIKRDGHIDIISKGVYSPCSSRIKIGSFVCPTWQLEGEKILHDNKNLFLYQKHSKMRVLNTPVFYIPYIVTPSPLRKERKSGFLTPGLALNFFDTKTSQSTSLPYYFNISEDKELLFTPIINYGGGVDSSQRFIFGYNQIISGGYFTSDLTFDSNLENKNNREWLTDASLITNFKKNLDTKYRLDINSALQTSKNYIQRTIPSDDLSYTNSLSTNFNLEGFNLNKIDDYLKVSLNFYQTNQENEDSKIIPTVLPRIKYLSGITNTKNGSSNATYEFYNIFREKSTFTHAEAQQKISHKYNFQNISMYKNSKINLNTEIYSQLFNTKRKLTNTDEYKTGSYARVFPIFGITSETPFKFKKNKNLIINPKIQLAVSPGTSNSNKLSNEDSTINDIGFDNIFRLNRYSGSDKMDNSKRLSFGISAYNQKFRSSLAQTYEITSNSNFHKEQKNDDNLSDLFGSIGYSNINEFTYNFRYDLDNSYIKKSNVDFKAKTEYGDLELAYLDQNSRVNNIIAKDIETFNYSFISKKFYKFSKFNISGLYNLKKEINTEYSLGYSYFDECFGINLDFKRKSYEEDELKPQDILTLMFSFKNIGSYKSTNLAVSKKQSIDWENYSINNDQFETD